MRTITTLLLLLSLCLSPLSAQALTYTLDSAIERALKANPTMEERLRALERASMDIGVAQSIFWPRAAFVMNKSFLRNSGSVGNTDELSSDTWSHGLRVTLSLFSGFTHLTNLQQSLIQKEIAKLAMRQAELELATNVKIQYFNHLQAKRDIRVAKEAIKRMETQLKASEAFVREELAPYVNVLQNQVELSRGQENLITAENALQTSRMQLNRFLGHDPGMDITYKGDIEDFPRQKNYDRQRAVILAMERRPDILIADKSIDVARKRAWSAAGEALPKVDLTYDNMKFDRDYESSRYRDYDRQYWSVGLNFTWTFFEGGRTVFSTLAEKKQAEALAAAYKNSVEGAKTDVMTAILNIESALQVYETAKRGIKAATESYAQARERYDRGIGTITELLDAQLRLTQAETRCSKAMADYQIAHAKYLMFIGGEEKNGGKAQKAATKTAKTGSGEVFKAFAD